MYRCTNVWVYMCVSVQVYGCTRAGDWVDYPTYYRKTLSLGESITIHNPNLLAQLTMPLPRPSGLGVTLKYCPPTMGPDKFWVIV